ncbi:MAG: CDP-diacylglycerol--serine O-phosphatidyltransferase [bacterium]
MDGKEHSSDAPSEMVRPRRAGIKKGVYILPSLFTTASLFCGFYSIIHSISGDFVLAAWAIMFAGVFDGLDGRVARLTKTQTEFGLEYDSLVDLASFGLAPSILVFTWNLHALNRIGWAAAFLFFACGALRLARFNVQSSSVEKRFFQGLPIPCAAYVLASLVIFHEHIAGSVKMSPYFVMPLTIVIALLMVSSIRYRSFKHIDFSKPQSFIFLVIAAVVVFVVASAPQETMFLASVAYVLMGIVDELLHLRHRKNYLEKRLAQKEQALRPQDHLKVVNLPSGEKTTSEKHL